MDPANQLTGISRNASLTYAGGLTNLPISLTINGVGADIYSNMTFATQWGIALKDGSNSFTNVLQTGPTAWVTNVLTRNLPASVNLAYDLDGSLISDGLHGYTYDCADQLIGIVVTNQWQSQFVYDGFGRRRIRREYSWVTNTWQQTSETRYVYDGMLVLQERDQNGTPRVTYTRGLDLSGGLQGAGGIGGLLARTDGNGSAYYYGDGGGNITAMVNGQGALVARYLYDPYGNVLGKWGALADANLMRFSSKEEHVPSGLYYYGYRFYDPNLQRWLNQDPIQELGGINLYRFVENSPPNFDDPFGLTDYPADFVGPLLPGDTRGGSSWHITTRYVMELVIPGQASWDRAMDSFWKGETANGASWISLYLSETALTIASFGTARMPSSSPVAVCNRTTVASADASAASSAAKGTLQTTAHGAERIAGAAATRGGVLSEAGVAAVRQGGRVMTQADGATVKILQNETGRFNVVVEGQRGIITTFENLSQKSLDRLGKNYGWK